MVSAALSRGENDLRECKFCREESQLWGCYTNCEETLVCATCLACDVWQIRHKNFGQYFRLNKVNTPVLNSQQVRIVYKKKIGNELDDKQTLANLNSSNLTHLAKEWKQLVKRHNKQEKLGDMPEEDDRNYV